MEEEKDRDMKRKDGEQERARERERERANISGALFRRLPATQQEDKYKEEEDIHL